jgi:hypothetical protein
MALFGSTTFESNAFGWRPVYQVPSVTAGVLADTSARTGGYVLRASSTVVDGSVAVDGWAELSGPADVVLELTVGAFAWVRAAPGHNSCSGSLVIHQLGLPSDSNKSEARFTVGNDWTLITNVLTFRTGEIPTESNVQYRVEFYLKSPNVPLDIDSVIIT